MILKIFVPDLPATEGQGDGGAGERDELQAAHVQQGGQGDAGDKAEDLFGAGTRCNTEPKPLCDSEGEEPKPIILHPRSRRWPC